MNVFIRAKCCCGFILVLLLSGTLTNTSLASSIRNFQPVTAVNSISQYSILCMVQDSTGFLWFGTKDGLNRFDGYEFLTYKYEPDNPNSLSNNEISCLTMQGDRYLWIGTRSGGINRLELYTDEITRFTNMTYDDLIREIYHDEEGRVWAGTSEGLFLYLSDDAGKESFVNVTRDAVYLNDNGVQFDPVRKNIPITSIFQLTPEILMVGAEEGLFEYHIARNELRSVSSRVIEYAVVTRIFRDSAEQLWAATYDGLIRLEKVSGQPGYEVVIYDSGADPDRRLPVDWVEDMVEDHRGNIWLATRGSGLVVISDNKVEQVYDHSVEKPSALPDNIINSILIDRTGVLWIGTESNELVNLDLYAKQFRAVLPGIDQYSGLSDHLVTSLTGNDKKLWAGTSSAGIDVFGIENGELIKKKNIPKVILSDGQWKSEILALLCDKQEVLWIGSATNSLVRYSEKEQFDSYEVEGFVFSLFEDDRDHIWFGTWGQGLGYINKSTQEIVQYNRAPDQMLGISSDKVLTIHQDSRDLLWIGTKGGGISVADIDEVINGTAKFVVYRHVTENRNSLSYNDVYDIYEDSRGHIWIASGRGLNRIVIPPGHDFKEGVLSGHAEFEIISESEGLPGGMVYSIREDHNGLLWLGTNNGLSRYSPFEETLVSYDVNDGLPSGKFHSNSSFRDSRSGTIYFGGVDGITVFHPDSIANNPFHANTKITDLLLHNRSVIPNQKTGNRTILTQNIANTDRVRLSHADNEISLKFSALHFSSPDKIRYSYRLLGFNDEWQHVGSQNRRATYTNLRYGEYLFQVQATNNDGVPEPTVSELLIIIDPPIWLTFWAYLAYILTFLFLLYVFRKYSLIAVKKKNQLIIESLENKKETEIAEAKMRFFTNVSHEIRTPLTLINAPLQQLLKQEDFSPEVKSTLTMIFRNVKRLLTQINQLLEFRKMEKGHYQLNVSQFSLDQLIRETLLDFDAIILQKEIEVELNFNNDLFINADKRLIATALHNLISNSLKFSPVNETLIIETDIRSTPKPAEGDNFDSEKMVIIRFLDQGPGIPEKELESVFDRFYQIRRNENDHLGGSGIGLSIVREFIEQHTGKVRAYNLPSGGCCFELSLPVGETSEKLTGPDHDGVDSSVLDNIPTNGEEKEMIKKLPRMCIIEDDQDLAGYLETVFKKDFRVSLFYDGAIAAANIPAMVPDLIICDVMLPGMNGIELTRKLKSNQETSHIPVVMLTARTEQENMLEGLHTGADSYVTKPFNVEVLQAQISSLVKSREAFRLKFSRQMVLEPTEEAITPMDEKFLSKLMEVTDKNLADASFDVTNLVGEMHMSHSIILKKVKSLTGLSLVEFIRSMRIKKAAQIFSQDKLSVSEVAFMVGFSDPKYFSKCFTKDMGKKPTEYIREKHG